METDEEKLLFKIVSSYITKYLSLPPKEAVLIEIENSENISEPTYNKAVAVTELIYSEEFMMSIFNADEAWVKDQIEAFCKNRAIYLAITQSIDIIDEDPNKKSKLDRGVIPKLLQDALSITMDTTIGHDYILDAAERYDMYHKPQDRISTGIKILDRVLDGGFRRKSLNVFIGGTGAGKSMTLCSIAGALLLQGYNVLYISLEMPEDLVGKRIDANLLDCDFDKIDFIPKDRYVSRINSLCKKGTGSIVIKDYPPSSVGATQFRALLNDLKIKKDFKPDVIVLDYLAITAPCTIKSSDNLYIKTKYVAEEFRALCYEFDAAGISAAQTQKGTQGASDFDLSEVGEGHSLSMTCDSMFGLIVTDQLEQTMQMRMKVLKNRHGSTTDPGSFLLNMERARMRLTDSNSTGYDSYKSEDDSSFQNTPIPNKRAGVQRNSNSKMKFADFKVS